ncbi:MAG: glycogen/starch/alpha-glucan phosphorylase, partial [Methylohalobius sp.]|nr:glycogen/starch/alpha-glucan phosphorylase [Methylohalobius sp.]
AYTVRDRILKRWMQTIETYLSGQAKSVSYLSAEFLIGPQLGSHLFSLGIEEAMRQALSDLGQDLEALLDQEEEPGLGNGGLGRLAACFLESLATLGILGVGYGIRYEFGIFNQEIQDGWQIEVADKWLKFGNPWEIPRPEIAFTVGFGGHTEPFWDETGKFRVRWRPAQTVRGVAYDIPIPGHRSSIVNLLRLWKAEATEAFDFTAFNLGDYYRAVEAKVASENLSKVLYPNDEPWVGKQLRLKQQYFFVACSLMDMIRVHQMRGQPLSHFHKAYAVQLNDTHPAIAIAELMRLLVDEHGLDWETAWHVTQNSFAYTNHTLLPEALEKWPVSLFAELLPRHLEIIYEINQRFLDQVRQKCQPDESRIARLSLIDESGERYVRMANLASVGSHAINGVSKLHTELLRRQVLADFHELFPEKFHSITNGVTPRRWLALCNPKLFRLICSALGEEWLCDAGKLRELEAFVGDKAFQAEFRAVKRANKERLAQIIRASTGTVVDPDSLFDIQVKRIHEYKRQHLNLLHCLALYLRLKRDPRLELVPRTVILGGKAAPGYFLAKLIIKLIHAAADLINHDRELGGRLKIVFIPNFNVKSAHAIYPAADLSEQISTAGKEASGTGNMKFALNGALTIATPDGANLEIRQAVGAENFFQFGLTAEDIAHLRACGYRPWEFIEQDEELKAVIEFVRQGGVSRGDRELFRPLVDAITLSDEYFLAADFRAYADCQSRAEVAFQDVLNWTQMAILNVARMGEFSSDRAVGEYAQKIWKVAPVGV